MRHIIWEKADGSLAITAINDRPLTVEATPLKKAVLTLPAGASRADVRAATAGLDTPMFAIQPEWAQPEKPGLLASVVALAKKPEPFVSRLAADLLVEHIVARPAYRDENKNEIVTRQEAYAADFIAAAKADPTYAGLTFKAVIDATDPIYAALRRDHEDKFNQFRWDGTKVVVKT